VPDIVLASSNAGKLREMREMLADLDIRLIGQTELGIDDAEETATTFVENALLKARHATAISGLPAIADDSGICVDELGGAPGLYSARYSGGHGDSAANIAKLLDALRGVPDLERGAYFHCSVVLLRRSDDPAPLIAEGMWHGRILDAPRGEKGFGYDPIFFDPTLDAGASELDARIKNRVSHRAQALTKLREMMRGEF
jgi:XTP/dITP diphosphohydrolase